MTDLNRQEYCDHCWHTEPREDCKGMWRNLEEKCCKCGARK